MTRSSLYAYTECKYTYIHIDVNFVDVCSYVSVYTIVSMFIYSDIAVS